MKNKDNLYKLRDIALKHIPIGSPVADDIKYLVHELEREIDFYNDLDKFPIGLKKVKECVRLEKELQDEIETYRRLKENLEKRNNIRPKTWVSTKEAVKYYGVSTQTVHIWRRNGKLKSRPAPNGKRMAYEYYLDPHIKEQIDEAKKYDKRWS